ncbi:hypothetical protein IF650_00615 [Cellulosimicrobium terreum]|nr:hypothetical protein [Cellulosimicrobium terreum]
MSGAGRGTPTRRTRVLLLTLLAVTVAAVAAVVVVLVSRGGETDARPVTTEEAERLAVARFGAWETQLVDLAMTVPVEDQTLHVTGRVDLRDHAGYAVVETGDDPPRHALLQWTLEGKGVRETSGEEPPAELPDDGWQVAAMAPGDPLDTALRLALNLGSDRPENPVLLRQNGARWVGTTEVDGPDGPQQVDVFTGPGPDGGPSDLVRYAVDDAGTLHRVDADTGQDAPLVIELSPADRDEPVPVLPDLAAP